MEVVCYHTAYELSGTHVGREDVRAMTLPCLIDDAEGNFVQCSVHGSDEEHQIRREEERLE